MDNLISLVEKRNFTQALKTLEGSNDMIKTVSASKRDNIIETLPFNAYTMVIQILLEDVRLTPDTLLIFNRFLREFDYEQVKLRFKHFCDLCKKIVSQFLEAEIGVKIVKGLQIALQRITAHEEGLSPLHIQFVKLCIQTKLYKQALPVIQRAVTCFNKSAEMSEEEITNYFYYSGHVFYVLERFEEAYIMFRFCLQFTHNHIYSSTLNAKKKLIMLALRDPKIKYNPSDKKFKIEEGHITRYLDFSRNLAADDIEVLNIFTKIYSDFINEEKLFNNYEELQKHFNENAEVFEEDKNLGLVRQVSAYFRLRKLKQLRKTYVNYSLSELDKVFDIKQEYVLQVLMRAIALKPIARINLKDQVLTFMKARDPYKLETLNKLHSLTNLLKQVSHEYNKEHETIIRDRISMPNTIFS